MYRFTFVALLALTACDPDTDPGVVDLPSGPPTNAAGLDLCPAVLGIGAEGTWWNYNTDGGAFIVTVDRVDERQGEVEVDLTEWFGDDSLTSTVVCDAEGAWRMFQVESHDGESVFTRDYGAGCLMVPHDLTQPWSNSCDVHSTASWGSELDESFTMSGEVLATETVTVPAGEFDVVRIRTAMNGRGIEQSFAMDVGLVRTSTGIELVDYQGL